VDISSEFVLLICPPTTYPCTIYIHLISSTVLLILYSKLTFVKIQFSQ